MKTSYFAKYTGHHGINIALKQPKNVKFKSYPKLFPKWSFLSKYFKDHNKEEYTKSYHKEVLSKLNPQEVYDELKGCTLLCWEKSGKFCHRRIVAEWLQKELGVIVPEK